MMTPQEALDAIALAYNCPDVSISEAIAAIQKDAHAQGRRDLHQDIKEKLLQGLSSYQMVSVRRVADMVDACYTKGLK